MKIIKMDKQTEALLKELKDKNSTKVKKAKNEVLTPDELKLKSEGFIADEKASPKFIGKVITNEDLEEERKKEKDESIRYSIEFFKQLETWSKVDDSDEYNDLTFDSDEYLIRLFKMDISDFKGYLTLNYEWSPILKNWTLRDVPLQENVFAIAKILKVGEEIEDSKYKVGDIILVPSTDIIGEDWNPRFIQTMQFQNSKGMKPILPEGMKQRLPNVVLKWDKYKFVRPWVPEPEDKDELTYLIPKFKVKGRYKV